MATKKKELLEQDAPVTETVMSEGETLLADTAQPESLPADAGDGLDLNELLGQMDQPHRPDSMGMICFFRDMILGRKAQFSSSLWMSKAWRMVFSSPT